ncbi:MAG TPA: MBL fold metallo-hydrolase [Balneolaceae bacterium]
MGCELHQPAVTFWGVRGSTPCANGENMEYGGNTTCVQVHIPGSDELLILDSGTGIRNLGRELMKGSAEIRGRIFITHPHWDHVQGFPFFKPIYGCSNHFEIHMPVQQDIGCRQILSGHLNKTFFPVTLEMMDANLKFITQPEKKMRYKNYEVEFMPANHSINTAAYKIHVGGKQIVFCPDNELNPDDEKKGRKFYSRFKEFLWQVDVLIHDAQYDRKSYQYQHGWGHSAWENVVDFARESKVKNLFLTHHDPDSDDEKLRKLDDCLKREFSDQFESIRLAKEGEKVLI